MSLQIFGWCSNLFLFFLSANAGVEPTTGASKYYVRKKRRRTPSFPLRNIWTLPTDRRSFRRPPVHRNRSICGDKKNTQIDALWRCYILADEQTELYTQHHSHSIVTTYDFCNSNTLYIISYIQCLVSTVTLTITSHSPSHHTHHHITLTITSHSPSHHTHHHITLTITTALTEMVAARWTVGFFNLELQQVSHRVAQRQQVHTTKRGSPFSGRNVFAWWLWVGRLFNHSVVQSLSHSIIRPFDHLTIQSFDHLTIRLICHPVIKLKGFTKSTTTQRQRNDNAMTVMVKSYWGTVGSQDTRKLVFFFFFFFENLKGLKVSVSGARHGKRKKEILYIYISFFFFLLCLAPETETETHFSFFVEKCKRWSSTSPTRWVDWIWS